jgi:hypothetical protein
VYSVVALAAAVAFFVGLDLAICPMAGFWGIPCPSCGLTRASLELMNGNWRSAFATHPGVVPVLIYLSVAALGARWWNRSAAFSRFGSGVGIVLLVCLTLLWGARFFGHFGGPVPVHAWRF